MNAQLPVSAVFSAVQQVTDSAPRFWNGPPVNRALTQPPPGVDPQWWKITNLGGNAADLWIYSEIGYWGVTAEGLVSELAALNVAEITVHLNSPGGDVFDGIAIMNALRDHPANVTIKVDALAASIASVIAQAGNKIIMGRNSTMMIHNASGFAMGEAKDLRKMADLLDGTTENIASIYAERAGGTVKQWLAVMEGEKWYDADEAVEAGLADEVAALPTEREALAAAARFDLSNYVHPPSLAEPAPDVVLLEPTGPLTLPVPADVQPEPALQVEFTSTMAEAFRAAARAAVPQPPPPLDPDLFRAAVSIATEDAPAPRPTNTPEPAPAAGFDPVDFAQRIREAVR